jgi:hypothetical protein
MVAGVDHGLLCGWIWLWRWSYIGKGDQNRRREKISMFNPNATKFYFFNFLIELASTISFVNIKNSQKIKGGVETSFFLRFHDQYRIEFNVYISILM